MSEGGAPKVEKENFYPLHRGLGLSIQNINKIN